MTAAAAQRHLAGRRGIAALDERRVIPPPQRPCSECREQNDASLVDRIVTVDEPK